MSLLTVTMILSSSISIVFTKITHPLAMGAILLVQTVITAVLVSFFLKSTWFSYILFLIFLGAMLVLFIYVASLAPNETFSISYPMVTLIVFAIALSAVIFIVDPVLLAPSIFIETSSSLVLTTTPTTFTLLAPMYNVSSMKMTIFLILYLLLTLVAVVKITATHFGPLRLN
uniref:NADH-ubiquinone oxidoreductase chain 6 n=1 Tax=Typhlatya sp. JR2016 TaxID=2010951 RepID=A0A1Z2R718_9EUCA|nr:NADH dehydrogenase subunit 6 [Typhlatya sp. JR2016]